MNVLPIYKVRLQTHIYKVIRLVHLLATFAAAAHKGFGEVILPHPQQLHALPQFGKLLWRHRHGQGRV